MSRGGLIIGLGGAGLRVAARVRQVLASSGQARMPETIRLLAFDVHKPAPATGRLPQSYYFLVQLPQPEQTDPASARPAAREALLADLTQGAVSSLTLRGLAAQLDALRRAGVTHLETFLVCTSFGSTGSAWLVDFAYLVRHLTANRMRVRVHAVLLAPEAFERAFFPTPAHQLTNFVVLKELESLQRARNWDSGVSLYGGKHLGSLPGLLKRAPFDTVQVVDAQELGAAPEAGAIPVAADGILCQLDAQAAAVLDEAAQFAQPISERVFSSFGVFSLVYPTRLALEQTVQRLIIGSIDQYLPLEKNADTGRPLRLSEPMHLRPDDPYGKLEVWVTDPHHSGVLQEILREGSAGDGRSTATRRALVDEMIARSLEQWKALFYQCEGAEGYLPQGDLLPEPMEPLVTCHVRVYLRALARRIANPDQRLGAPLEYLQKLEQALGAYLQDLDAAVDAWRDRGETSENEALQRSLGDARKDWETRRTSLLGRLMPNAAQDAQERYIQARQSQARYKQRETIVGGIVQAVSAMRLLTHRLLELGQRLLRSLALLPDSVYNVALDQSQRLEREMRFESAVRSQQLVVDQGYETRQSRLVFGEFGARLANQIAGSIEGLGRTLDWDASEQRLPFQVSDPNLEGEGVLLDDPQTPPEQLAALVTRALSFHFGSALVRIQPDNSVLNFLSYLDPRADRLAGRLVNGSAPAARLLTSVQARRSFLFSPQATSQAGTTYSQTLLGELQLHLGDVYVFQTPDPDRLTLFRYYDGLGLDNLLTIHNSEPRTLDPAQLRPYVLWNL